MSTDIRLKVCGLTTQADACAAHAARADYLGFVFYPPSPRNISPAQFARMRPQLPPRKFVAVCVAPSADDLARLAGLGFD
ncbi:MAG: phosphoribosylanthranilate isomerase, partial [Burkholderiales bacterium]